METEEKPVLGVFVHICISLKINKLQAVKFVVLSVIRQTLHRLCTFRDPSLEKQVMGRASYCACLNMFV